jgi:hypothetical protein
MSIKMFNVDGQQCVMSGDLPNGYTEDRSTGEVVDSDGKVVGMIGCCPVGPIGEIGTIGRNKVGKNTPPAESES